MADERADGTTVGQVFEAMQPLGVATNNVAEYKALILGMKVAQVLGATQVHVFGDSKLVCNQMKGEWAVRNAGLRPLHKEASGIMRSFNHFDIEYIPRAKNEEADALANKAMDGECSGLDLLSRWEELHKPARPTHARGKRGLSQLEMQEDGPSASNHSEDCAGSEGRRCHKACSSMDAAGVNTSGFCRSFPADFAGQSLGRKARKYSRSVLRGGMNLFTKRAPH